jgi:small-conductance mechanosensitive channel
MAIIAQLRTKGVSLCAPLIRPLALAAIFIVLPRTAWTQDKPKSRSTFTSAQSTAAVNTSSSAAVSAATGAECEAVTAYLGQVIGWYRHLEVEQRLATEPAEVLYLADDRQTAAEVVQQAFAYARAEAALLHSEQDTSAPGSGMMAGSANGDDSHHNPSAGDATILNPADLIARRNEAQTKLNEAHAQLQNLQARLAQTRESKRDDLNHQILAVEAEIDLAQSRVDSINEMGEFETGNSGSGATGAGLDEQIDELERSLPQAGAAMKPQAAASAVAAVTPLAQEPMPAGILGRVEGLLEFREKELTLSDRADATAQLLATVVKRRAPLIQTLRDVNGEASALTKRLNASDPAAVIKQNPAEFETLSARHKQVVAALLPLSKQSILLNLYHENLMRWRGMGQQQFNETLRSLILRLLGLALLLAVVFAAAFVWRKLTFRYVQDLQRRHQLLQLRRLALIVVIFLVLIFDFANELGALATVMGFAAAGIAFALQNVILSVAGYFYMSGRFGIRTGDRVEISGINGDVLEVGLFKLTMMELTQDQTARQPTGRVAVFPNSVVFQTNGNFFKQAPGASFIWREVRLTLAPECDYRLAEHRLFEVVNEVFGRYGEMVQRESRAMEKMLNVAIETPRPQSRMFLGESGLEIVIRYPAQTLAAAQTADEISRRLVDAINRDPALKLVAQTTPAIQPMAQPQSEAVSDQASAPNGSGA